MTQSRRLFLPTLAGLYATSSLSSGQAQSRGGFVHTSGKDLISPSGGKLRLRGINLGNWLEPEGYMFLFDDGPQSPREIETLFNELIGPSAAKQFWIQYQREYITKADIDYLAASGFNSVRIPLHYKFFLTDGDIGFELLEPVVKACAQAKLWVILDMHCAPGGQTGTNIDDSWGYPWVFDSEQDQQLTCDIWKRIAKHYRDETIVLGYDLLNEPIPHFPQLRHYNSALDPLYKRIVKAIREVDRNHVVILGGAQWDSNFEVFGPPFDENSMYTFHKYWTPPNQESIQPYLDFRDRYKVPIWLGESGENDDEWITQFVRVLETNNVGWCFWPYKKMEKATCVRSVLKPPYWDEVIAFAKLPVGTGNAEKRIAARPTPEHLRTVFDGLLANIRLDACRPNPGYLHALGLITG